MPGTNHIWNLPYLTTEFNYQGFPSINTKTETKMPWRTAKRDSGV